MGKRRRVFELFVLTIALVVGAVLVSGAGAESADSGGRTVIRNASMVVTMDPALGTLENADVLIEGDRIAAVGAGIQAGRAKVVDGRGKIVLPGFVDVHTHLWQSLIRGCATDKELNGWLGGCVFPLSGSPVNGQDAYAGVRLSTLDAISTGVTTVTDWSHAFNAGFARGNVQALNDSRMRYVFAYYRGTDDNEIRTVKRTMIDPNPLGHLQIAGRAAMVAVEELRGAERLSRELGVALNVHLHESKADPATGQMESLRQAGALRPGLLANHAIHMTGAELDELAAHDVRVAHNPLSNMRLASGIAKLPDMKARNIKVGLGLDGGTNDTSDMFNNLRAAVGLQRALSTDPARYPTPADALRLATLGGAEVLGLDKEIGSLTPGKKADLQVIDTHQLNFAPRVDWASQLVFNTQPANVQWVFVNGVALKKDGRVQGDIDRIIAEAQVAADKIAEILNR